MSASPPIVVFDLDGTLADSAPAIGKVLNEMRAERGLAALKIDAFRGWISLGAPNLVAAALDISAPADAAAIADFRERYARHPASPHDLYPGVVQALELLQEAGAPMGVCSNKPHALCEKVLVETGIRHFFKAVSGGDSVPRGKPHPMHLSATLSQMGCAGRPFFFVGDSTIDADAAAAAAEASFLWASYGYADSAELPRRGVRLDSPHDIAPAILMNRAA